jgi:hypothetical protein
MHSTNHATHLQPYVILLLVLPALPGVPHSWQVPCRARTIPPALRYSLNMLVLHSCQVSLQSSFLSCSPPAGVTHCWQVPCRTLPVNRLALHLFNSISSPAFCAAPFLAGVTHCWQVPRGTCTLPPRCVALLQAGATPFQFHSHSVQITSLLVCCSSLPGVPHSWWVPRARTIPPALRYTPHSLVLQ